MARFRLRKSGGGSTVRGGDNLQGSEAAGDVDLAGSGHASSDASGPLGVTWSLAGGGDAASDASADLTVDTPIVELAGSGHAASDGSGDLTTVIVLTVDITLPAMVSAHDLLTSIPHVMVGGVILPSSSPNASASYSTQRTGLVEPSKYIPKYFSHQRQVLGLADVGLLTLQALSVPTDPAGNGTGIVLFTDDWVSTPGNPRFDVSTQIDVRINATVTDWNTGNDYHQALITKEQGWPRDGDWVFWLDGEDGPSSGFLHFDWWDTGGTFREAVTVADVPERFGTYGVRVTVLVGAGDTVVKFYHSFPSGAWTLMNTVNMGAEYPMRNTSDNIEVGTHNNGDTNELFPTIDNPPYPLEGTVHWAQVRSLINGTPVANLQASMFRIGDLTGVRKTDTAGNVWTLKGTNINVV